MLGKLIWLIKKRLKEFDFDTYPKDHRDEGCNTKKTYYDSSNECLKDNFIEDSF